MASTHPATRMGPVALYVADMDRELEFYEHTLGLGVRRREGDTVTLGAGVTIDPDDYGVSSISAGGDATVTSGAGLTIVVGNTDGDGTAFGVYAESGAAADNAVGDEAGLQALDERGVGHQPNPTPLEMLRVERAMNATGFPSLLNR